MRRLLSAALLWAFSAVSFAQQPPLLTESLPWFKDSFLDIREDVAEAAEAGRHVILYFHQNACPYCDKLLRDNFGQREISRRTQAGFDVISIDLWGDREVIGFDGGTTTEKRFAAALEVMYTPTLLLLDQRGNVALRINGYYPPHRFNAVLQYVSDQGYRQQSFRDYLQQVNPAPASGKLHVSADYPAPPYRLDRRGGSDRRPLLVLFEQRQCLACDEMHDDILRRPETGALLDQLSVAVVDMWSNAVVETPDGRTTTVAQWAADLDIMYAPSMVFFSADGDELFRSEAYLRAFHTQSVLDYVGSGAYREYPELQRYIQARADSMREQGIAVDLWK